MRGPSIHQINGTVEFTIYTECCTLSIAVSWTQNGPCSMGEGEVRKNPGLQRENYFPGRSWFREKKARNKMFTSLRHDTGFVPGMAISSYLCLPLEISEADCNISALLVHSSPFPRLFFSPFSDAVIMPWMCYFAFAEPHLSLSSVNKVSITSRRVLRKAHMLSFPFLLSFLLLTMLLRGEELNPDFIMFFPPILFLF